MLPKEAALGVLPSGVVKGSDQAGQEVEHELVFFFFSLTGPWPGGAKKYL